MHAGKAGWCSYLSVFSLRGAVYHRYGGLLLNILLSNVPIRSLVLKLNFKKVAGMMLAFNPYLIMTEQLFNFDPLSSLTFTV